MIMYRGFLSRPPDETDHRKAFERVAIQQVLLIELWMRLGADLGQPVVFGYQRSEQCAAVFEHPAFSNPGGGNEAGVVADEITETGGVGHANFRLPEGSNGVAIY